MKAMTVRHLRIKTNTSTLQKKYLKITYNLTHEVNLCEHLIKLDFKFF